MVNRHTQKEGYMTNLKSEAEFEKIWIEELEEVYRYQLGLPDLKNNWSSEVVR